MKKGGLCLLLALLAAMLLAGCESAELEDRSFPMELAVDDTADFGLEWLNEEQSGSKYTDYNHLKVLLIGEEFLEDAAKMDKLLDFLEKKPDIPRNTYVFVAEDAAKLLTAGENPSGEGEGKAKTAESVGTYLEQLVENSSLIQKEAYPTLGMLYQEQENRMETLFLPYVELDKTVPVITGYYAWVRGTPAGRVDTQAALLAAFTAGNVEKYSIQLGTKELIGLWDAQSTTNIENNQIVIKLKCKGEVILGEGTKKETLRGLAERYLNETAEAVRLADGVDVTNSYRKLGGINRTLYFTYLDRAGDYEKEMGIHYELTIIWVNQ